MTHDEIIEMARQAGIVFHALGNTPEELEAFAKLVEERTAAKERADEREACAKVCEEVGEHPSLTPLHCVESIRARGEA